MPRFQSWLGLTELQAPTVLSASGSVDAACDQDGNWRGVTVFIHESDGWAVFHDLTGYLASFSAGQWLEFAKDDELVFAGYSDAVPYGQLIVISNGKIERNFLDDQQNPGENVDQGMLDVENESPIETWIDVGSFVDDDELGYEPDAGHLWIFEKAT